MKKEDIGKDICKWCGRDKRHAKDYHDNALCID